MSQSSRLPTQATSQKMQHRLEQEEKEKKREFQRTMYRRVGTEVDQLDPKLSNKENVSQNIEKMQDRLSDIQTIYEMVDRTNEALIDADVLQRASKIVGESTRTLELGSSSIFNVFDFIGGVKNFMGIESQKATGTQSATNINTQAPRPNSAGMCALGERAAGWFGHVSTSDFLVGPMSTEYTKPKAKTVRERVPTGPVTKVGDIGMDNVKTATNMMTKLIKGIFTQLIELNTSEEEPVGLFEFALNPESFSQSVENLFYISFLVHDGRVGISFDDDGIPSIYTVPLPRDPEAAHEETMRRKKLPTNQMIFDLDFGTWQDLVKYLDIKEPHIPTREPVQQVGPTTGTWFSG